jgi:hypothetical protein
LRKISLLFLVAACTPLVQADTFGFGCITGNSATNCGIGEAQLRVEVTDAGSNQVLFTFVNLGPLASVIEAVYFDDGTLLGIAQVNVSNVGNVVFSQGGSPPDLPGGNSLSPAFEVSAGFLADADSPSPQKGVGPNEQLGILFNLLPGVDFGDTIAALNGGDHLRIGVHVQSFAGGGSESFVNDPNTPQAVVPEPSSILLLGSALVGAVHFIRKRKSA